MSDPDRGASGFGHDVIRHSTGCFRDKVQHGSRQHARVELPCTPDERESAAREMYRGGTYIIGSTPPSDWEEDKGRPANWLREAIISRGNQYY